MKKERDEITDLFRSRLCDAEMPVRDGFWDDLEKDFPPTPVVRRKIYPFRFAAAAAVLLVLLCVSAAIWLFSPEDEIEGAFSQVAVVSGQGGALNKDVVKETFSFAKISPAVAKLLPATPITVAGDEEEDSISVSFSFSFSMSATTNHRNHNNNPYHSNQYVAMNSESNTYSSATDSEAGNLVAPLKNTSKGWFVGASALAVTSAMGKDYKMPVTVGVNIGKQLSGKWNIESGLNYTLLRSGVGNTQQKVQYVGIPVKVNYTYLDTKKVDLYLSGGGLLEKCISAKRGDESLSAKNIQASLMASAGVQYKINKNVALFAEPALAYNFDNGSSVRTIRQEKPLNFNLLCGVRVMY